MTEFESVKHSFRLGSLIQIFGSFVLIANALPYVPFKSIILIICAFCTVGVFFRLKKTNLLHKINAEQRKKVIKKYKFRNWTLLPFAISIFIFSGLFYAQVSSALRAAYFGLGATLFLTGIFSFFYTLKMSPRYGSEVFD